MIAIAWPLTAIVTTLVWMCAAAATEPPKLRGSDQGPAATDVRIGGDSSRTRFILDVSRPVDLHVFALADPYRVVVDLPQVAFQLPAKTGETGRGLIKAFRYGLIMQGSSRIVIDVTSPVRIDKASILEAQDGLPARLVIELVPVDRETFMRQLAMEKPPKPAQPAKRPDRDAASESDGRPWIVIDPGHGGLDRGTKAASGDTEKAVVLEYAQLLREKLDKTGKYRIAMTRTDDSFVALADRVRMARMLPAAMFISVHADAFASSDGGVRGASVYTLSDTATDAESARLAEAENRADVIAGVDLAAEPDEIADILIDLAQRETKGFSIQFARTLVTELKTSARLHKNPIRSAGFRVLKAPDVPSVLIELGYMSNEQDFKLMKSDAWRAKTTDSIVSAIGTYFGPRLAGAPGVK